MSLKNSNSIQKILKYLPDGISHQIIENGLQKFSHEFLKLLLSKADVWEVVAFIRLCTVASRTAAPTTTNDKQQKQSATAPDFLKAGLAHMQARASTYDAPAGERSMAKTVAMFNTYAGTEITEEQGWHFMEILKMVRSSQGEFKADNYEDGSAYAGLAGEAAARERGKKDAKHEH